MTWLLPLFIAVCVAFVVYRSVMWVYDVWDLGRMVSRDDTD